MIRDDNAFHLRERRTTPVFGRGLLTPRHPHGFLPGDAFASDRMWPALRMTNERGKIGAD